MPPRNLAEARRLHPDLGFALYALEPRGAVTLEVLDGETSHTFVGVTEAEAWSAAFPGAAPDEPPGERKTYELGIEAEDDEPAESPWQPIDTAPTDRPVVARMRTDRLPGGWFVATVTLPDPGDESRFAGSSTIWHYNGDVLMSRFRGAWTDWLPDSSAPAEPVDEPAPPAEPARAPSVFD